MADDEAKPDHEILPPDPTGGKDESAANFYLAQVSNYTDRPDLLIAEIEKHDSGFVKRMNAASERDASQRRDARFKFGKIQAYSGLAVSVISAVSLLVIIGIAVWFDRGFWSIVGLGLVFAITQSGSHGFSRLVEGVRDLVAGKKNPSDE